MKKPSSTRTFALVLTIIAVSAVTVYALSTVRLALGTIASSQLFDGPADVAISQITMQPGDVIPWHYHPGLAYVVVKSGSITEDEGCGGSEVFNAGQALEEPIPRVHQVRNTGSVPAELYSTVIVPAGQTRTINTGGPLCGPPKNKDQCKSQGWMNFSFPRAFANQGDCVSYVENSHP
jgi:quercetin dioxygenase-like cupin family protein